MYWRAQSSAVLITFRVRKRKETEHQGFYTNKEFVLMNNVHTLRQ